MFVSTQEAGEAIKALAAAHKEYFDRAPPGDGDVITLGKVETCVSRVCQLLALAVVTAD